jgi:hypothetical protein
MHHVLKVAFCKAGEALVPASQDQDMEPLDEQDDEREDPIDPEDNADQDPVDNTDEQLEPASCSNKKSCFCAGVPSVMITIPEIGDPVS